MTRRQLRLAVLGDPLDYTRSPDLHRAGLEALGIACESRAIRTPREALGVRLRELAGQGCRGVNLTAPLKHAALAHLARVSGAARRARSVNTVGFDPAGAWGDTTDGPGFLDLLRWLGRRPAAERVVLLGAGGAARSLSLALIECGCEDIAVSARRPEAAEDWREIPEATLVAWRSRAEIEALGWATLVVHATPLADAVRPAPLEAVARGALVVDLCYGPRPTPWICAARAAGLHAWDGLGLLVFQARRSLSLWTGREVPVDPLARAVGWPR